MANQIVCVLVETCGLRIYAIMLPPSDFSVAHWASLYCVFLIVIILGLSLLCRFGIVQLQNFFSISDPSISFFSDMKKYRITL